MNKKFEIIKNTIEISHEECDKIVEGCTLQQSEAEPEKIESFDSQEDAMIALGKYESNVVKLSGSAGSYYAITEFYVEENNYDEDGDWVSGGDVWKFSPLPNIED